MKIFNTINDISNQYRIYNNLYSVTIEITSFCNWRCEHCYIDDYTIQGFSLEKFEDLLNDLRKMGVYEIVFTGGEVFAHRNAMEMIIMAREKYFNVIIYSNISLLNDEKIKILSNLYIDYITCTVFSLKSDIHDNITKRPGSLNRTLKNIDLLSKNNIKVQIKTPIMKKNYKSIFDLYEFCKKRNISYKVDAQIVPNRSLSNDNDDYQLSIDELTSIQKNIDLINGSTLINKTSNFNTCDALKLSLYITSNGNVQPCSLYNKTIGNIYQKNIKDIWETSNIKKMAQYSLKESHNCSTCELINYCTQCPGISYAQTNDSKSCSSICRNTALARRDNHETIYQTN